MRGEGAAVLEDNASLFAGRWGRNWEVACTLASPTLDERDAKSLCEFKMIHSLLSESIGRLLVCFRGDEDTPRRRCRGRVPAWLEVFIDRAVGVRQPRL